MDAAKGLHILTTHGTLDTVLTDDTNLASISDGNWTDSGTIYGYNNHGVAPSGWDDASLYHFGFGAASTYIPEWVPSLPPPPSLDIFNIDKNWLNHPSQGLEPFRTVIQYPGSGLRLRNISDEIQIKFTASFTNMTKTIENTLLTYFNTHMGRLKAFWVPVPKNYFFATTDIGASDTTINIMDVSPIWLRGYERMFIVTQQGNLYHAKIMSLTSSTMVIDAPIGAVSKSNISIFGKLIWARFDMDEVQMHYISPGISECDLSFIELPKEYVV